VGNRGSSREGSLDSSREGREMRAVRGESSRTADSFR
jgi:hypothetical protein